MKLFLLALMSAVGLACVAAESSMFKEGYYFEDRPRLGHFGQEPWLYLYEAYASAFVKPLYPDVDRDNYLNFVPEGHRCDNYLRSFVNNEYKVKGVEEFTLLDACLGYAFESTYQEQDGLVDAMTVYTNDQTLKDLYHNTKIRETTREAQECLGGLLFTGIQIKKQYPNRICNVHMLESFVNFAECAHHLTPEARESDSYVKFILEMVKERGNYCFKFEITQINEAVRKYRAIRERVVNKLSSPFSSLRKQTSVRMWDNAIQTILSAIQGTKEETNLRRSCNAVRGITVGGEIGKAFEEKFLRNMGNYAARVIKPKKLEKKDLVNDPDGSARYLAMVDGMCRRFRTQDTEAYYDFFTPFYMMIRMTKHEDIFGLSEQDFVRYVLTHAYESAPTYLSVSACNILTFTKGSFTFTKQNQMDGYQVYWIPNRSEMIKWPVPDYY